MSEPSTTRPPLPLLVAVLVALPGSWFGLAAYAGLPAPDLPPPALVLVYGSAIVGAAFVLAWAAEAAQVDVNAGIALALLAFVAVLPEYAVDFVFTLRCGSEYAASGGSPDVCNLALANMTGANRVLVGVGWPLVVLVATLAVWRARRHSGEGEDVETASTHRGEVRLAPVMSVEVGFLGFATLYSLTLPLRSSLTLIDSAVFIGLFAAYSWRLSKMSTGEPDLLGTSAWIGHQDTGRRRGWVVGLFLVAAAVILLAAEHFADSLVETGTELGVDQFLLVQWVAPLASESPELLVAALYAWRLRAEESLGTLLSSKVNQWTLLVGGLPIVFAISAGTLHGLPLDPEQRYELLLTAAQSLFAVALLLDLRLTVKGAGALVVLFAVQFGVSVFGTDQANRIAIWVLSGLYVAMAVVRVATHWKRTRTLVRDATYSDLGRLQEEEPA